MIKTLIMEDERKNPLVVLMHGDRQVSTIYGSTAQYQVILEVAPEYQTDPTSLSKIYVRSSQGRLVPLDTVARFARRNQVLLSDLEKGGPSSLVLRGLALNMEALRRAARRLGDGRAGPALVHDHRADRLAARHQVEALVDALERQYVS